MMLSNDVDIELAAAFACCLQKNTQNNQLQTKTQHHIKQSKIFEKVRYFTRSVTSNLATAKQQNGMQNDIERISDDVDCHAVLPEPRSKRRQSRTGGSIPPKIAEWKNKLDHLSFLFSSLSNGTISAAKICDDLNAEFRGLITFLCYTTSSKRPATVFTPVELYAGSLVKLHQFCVVGTNNGSERILYVTIHEVISFWLRFLHRKNLNNLNKYDRFWLHTRAVITRMFRNIFIQECILAVKHSLASLLKELTMLVLENGEYGYGFYACEQIEYLMTMLSHQIPFVSY